MIRYSPKIYSLFGRRIQPTNQGDRPIVSFAEYLQCCRDTLSPLKKEFFEKLIALSSRKDIPGDFDVILCRGLRADEFAPDIYLHTISRTRNQAYLDLIDLEIMATLYEQLYEYVRPIFIKFIREGIIHQAKHVELEKDFDVAVPIDETRVRGVSFVIHSEALFRLVDMFRLTGLRLSYKVIGNINAYLTTAAKGAAHTTYLSVFDGDINIFIARYCWMKASIVKEYNLLLAEIYCDLGREYLGYALAYGSMREKILARRALRNIPDKEFPDNGEEQLILQAKFRNGDLSLERTIISRDPDEFDQLPPMPAMPMKEGDSVYFAVDREKVPTEFQGKVKMEKGVHTITLTYEELMTIFKELGLIHQYAYGKLNSGLGTRWAAPGYEHRAKGIGIIPVFKGRSFTEVGAAHLLWARKHFQADIPMPQLISFFTPVSYTHLTLPTSDLV